MAESLATILSSIRGCCHCAARFAETSTAHQPNPIVQAARGVRLCIAGQAPGLRAHAAGKPFADPSGVRLRSWMGVDEKAFYDRRKVAIAPMAFCFPGYNAKGSDLPPPKDCAQLWRAQLFEALPKVETILLVGKSAMAWHLPSLHKKKLEEIVRLGPLREKDAHEGSPWLFPLPHPSWRNNTWLKKNPWFESDILPQLRAEVSRLLA